MEGLRWGNMRQVEREMAVKWAVSKQGGILTPIFAVCCFALFVR
jgi:hypothetical protein